MKKTITLIVLMLIGMICMGQSQKDINDINTGDTLVLTKSMYIGYTILDPEGNIFEDLHKVKKGEYVVTSVNMDADRDPKESTWTFMIRSLKTNEDHEVMMSMVSSEDFERMYIK